MIIKGNPAGSVAYWSNHLLRDDTNERAEVVEIRGLLSEDLPGALKEMEFVASGSRCQGNFMYAANINPDEKLTPEQWNEAVDTLEKNLNLEGHQRIVVEHEKEGRTHRHIVWNRVDGETMRVTDMGGNWPIHTATARELEQKFGHTPTPSPTSSLDHKRAPELYEIRAAERSGIKTETVKEDLTAAWQQADSGKAFKAMVEERGYILTRGDKAGVLGVVDPAGDFHPLARRLDGVRAREINARMVDIDRELLPTVTEARVEARGRESPVEAIRLYRGLGNNVWEASPGEAVFFSTDPERAAAFGKLHFLDILPSELEKFERPHSQRILEAEPLARNDLRTSDPEILARLQPLAEPLPVKERGGIQPLEAAAQAPLGHAAGEMRLAWNLSDSVEGFSSMVDARGMSLARVDQHEAAASIRASAFAKSIGNFAPTYSEGEIVVVNRYGGVQRINERATGQGQHEIDKVLGGIDQAALLSVTDTRAVLKEAARIEFFEQRQIARETTPIEQRINTLQREAMTAGAFAAALFREGLTIARADVSGIEGLARDQRAAFAVEGKDFFAPTLAEGELVAVNGYGGVYRLNPSKLDLESIELALSAGNKAIPSLGYVRDDIAANRAADQALYEAKSDEFWKGYRESKDASTAAQTEKWQEGRESEIARVTEGGGPDLKAGFMVMDAATGAATSLISFVAGIGGSTKTPAEQSTALSSTRQIQDNRRAIAALESIRDSIDAGEGLKAEDIQHLTPNHIENIKLRGDDYLRSLIEQSERSYTLEKDYGRERER